MQIIIMLWFIRSNQSTYTVHRQRRRNPKYNPQRLTPNSWSQVVRHRRLSPRHPCPPAAITQRDDAIGELHFYLLLCISNSNGLHTYWVSTRITLTVNLLLPCLTCTEFISPVEWNHHPQPHSSVNEHVLVLVKEKMSPPRSSLRRHHTIFNTSDLTEDTSSLFNTDWRDNNLISYTQ